MSLTSERNILHETRVNEIARRRGEYIKNGIVDPDDLKILDRADRERFGTFEGCGCPKCARHFQDRANAVIRKWIKDKKKQNKLGFYIEASHNVRTRLVTYEEYNRSEELRSQREIAIDSLSRGDNDDQNFFDDEDDEQGNYL